MNVHEYFKTRGWILKDKNDFSTTGPLGGFPAEDESAQDIQDEGST
jgi:hypothetical protein